MVTKGVQKIKIWLQGTFFVLGTRNERPINILYFFKAATCMPISSNSKKELQGIIKITVSED